MNPARSTSAIKTIPQVTARILIWISLFQESTARGNSQIRYWNKDQGCRSSQSSTSWWLSNKLSLTKSPSCPSNLLSSSHISRIHRQSLPWGRTRCWRSSRYLITITSNTWGKTVGNCCDACFSLWATMASLTSTLTFATTWYSSPNKQITPKRPSFYARSSSRGTNLLFLLVSLGEYWTWCA